MKVSMKKFFLIFKKKKEGAHWKLKIFQLPFPASILFGFRFQLPSYSASNFQFPMIFPEKKENFRLPATSFRLFLIPASSQFSIQTDFAQAKCFGLRKPMPAITRSNLFVQTGLRKPICANDF